MYFGGGMPLDKKEADEENDVDTANVEAAFALLMRAGIHPGDAGG